MMRLRFLALWLSQSARGLADHSLRMYVVLELASLGDRQRDGAWHQVTALFILPFLVLAPGNGAICNSLSRRWVLVAASAYCLSIPWLGQALAWPWLVCIALSAIGTAIYSPARYAMLPAVAQDTGIPLSRVNGFIEMGGSAGIVAGMLVGYWLHAVSWSQVPASLSAFQVLDLPVAVTASMLFSCVALLTALPAAFPSDLLRPEPPLSAVAGFFRDSRRVMSDPHARSMLAGLVSYLALITVGAGSLVAYRLGTDNIDIPHASVPETLLAVGLGVAFGSLLAGIQGHPFRSLGLVPFGAVGLVCVLVWTTLDGNQNISTFLLGLMGGFINVPLRAAYQAAVPPNARGNAMAIMNFANNFTISVLSLAFFGLASAGLLSAFQQLGLLTIAAALAAFIAWRRLLRPAYELFVEMLFWPIYRVRGQGPGLHGVPSKGPLLVLANHTCWFDPVFLATVLSRPIIGMLTSVFFDVPFLRILAEHVVHAIRVPASTYRREAPELAEAIAALDRGECVLIFPEGRLRRSEEELISPFGRGVWHILKERPDTPVLVCWIEGAWGTFASNFNGKPATNKRLDFWKRIDVVVLEPLVLDSDLLSDHRATRNFLLEHCLGARRLLGLPADRPARVAADAMRDEPE